MHAIESRPDVVRWLYWEPRTEAEVSLALDRRIAWPPERGLTVGAELLATGELIGRVSLTVEPAHRQGEIGFIFHPDHQGSVAAPPSSPPFRGVCSFGGARQGSPRDAREDVSLGDTTAPPPRRLGRIVSGAPQRPETARRPRHGCCVFQSREMQ